MSFKFKLIPPCYQDATSYDDSESDFLLEMDDWNDWGFRTYYHLHASKKLTKNTAKYLGFINIMKIGQTEQEPQLLYGLYKDEKVFTCLPEEYISISFSIDLYRNIILYLKNKKDREIFIKSLHLIFNEDEPIFKILKEDKCFNKSILRSATMDDYSLRKGKALLYNEGTFYDLENYHLKINIQNSSTPLDLYFGAPETDSDNENNLPYGIIALIGHNGCGKSTFMYKLAKLLYMTPFQREFYHELKIQPNDIGITKVLFFSFSAFDNFLFPGTTINEYQLMAEGVRNNNGRFVYCGLRNIVEELQTLKDLAIEKREKNFSRSVENFSISTDSYNNRIDQEIINHEYVLENDRIHEIALKTNNALWKDFNRAIKNIIKDKEKNKRWNKMLKRSSEILPSLFNIIKICNDYIKESEYEQFSAGIKFFINSLSYIFAYCEDNSLLLFDEPENFLHPPLLSFMLNEIKNEIRNTHSVVLISTHSPVIIQELFSKNIFIVNRIGNELNFRHPEIEVYGETFGEINNIVFGLNSDISDYHKKFDDLYKQWNCKTKKTFGEVIELFKKNLSCEKLSTQMISYLANKFYSKGN